MAENNAVKSRREQHLERLRKRNPEKKFEDDEEIFGQISDDYDHFEEENGAMREREKAFSDMFIRNPKSARLMMEWKDGKDPVASLIRIYGKDEILSAIEDPERLEAIEEANREFAEKVAKNDEYEAQYEKNLPESLRAIEEWSRAEGISDDEIDEAVTALSRVCGDFILGKITPDTIKMMLNALNHDADVAEAQKEGEVAGKNAKIVEKMRRSKKGDGIQPLNGRNGRPAPEKRRNSIFDLAREAD